MIDIDIANETSYDLDYKLSRSELREELEAVLQEESLVKGVVRFVLPEQELDQIVNITLKYYNAYVNDEFPYYRPEYWSWCLPLALVLTGSAKEIVEYLKKVYGLSQWRPHRGWPA